MSFESDFFHSLQQEDLNFNELALKLFRHQGNHVPVYKEFLKLLSVDPGKVTAVEEIPFLPVSFFKTHKIQTEGIENDFCFTSSTTTGGVPSKHYVPDLAIYDWILKDCFIKYLYSAKHFCFFGLLPNYIERGGSSLVYMVQQLMNASKYPQSNFYLHDFAELHKQIKQNESEEIPTLLIGVTYALLDFAEAFPGKLNTTIVMETGGMKGKREEMLRKDVHERLKTAFQADTIYSEYGMTELLSQAYSKGNGIFESPPWMKVFTADMNDARTILQAEKAGSINIIDLANIYSCAFIATDDLGMIHHDGSFEIIGRKDNSDIRGCGLMYI